MALIMTETTLVVDVDAAIDGLRRNGSVAAPGFLKPEGIVIWHEAARQYFKKTLEKDDVPKSIST